MSSILIIFYHHIIIIYELIIFFIDSTYQYQYQLFYLNIYANIDNITMPSTVVKATKPIEATAPKKKLVKKDTAAKKDAEVKKTSKTKKESPKSEKTKVPKVKKEKASKESKADSTTAVESNGEEDTPKKKKSINVKPTLGDVCGLNLSVAKIKNIISNNCINKEAFEALQILKSKRVFPDGEGADDTEDADGDEGEKPTKKKAQKKPFTFTLADVPASTIAYLEKCYRDVAVSTYTAHNRVVIGGLNEADKKRYAASKTEALAKFETDQRNSRLFRDTEFDLIAFNKQFKSDFYKKMKEEDKDWKSYKDMKLYDYCVTILNKTKTRFNSEAKIYITALVEFIIRQLIINGTRECVNRDKKIIKIEHAIIDNDAEFTLFPFIKSTYVYKTFVKNASKQEGSDADVDDTSDDGEGAAAVTVPYKHYIGELCRNVRMELSAEDRDVTDVTESRYNQTSVSKKFKQFCSDAIIELLEILGNAIKVEVSTRNVKTVNYSIIYAVLYTSHIFHNISIDDTISFIQDKYNTYNDFLKKREKRTKADAKKGNTSEPTVEEAD